MNAITSQTSRLMVSLAVSTVASIVLTVVLRQILTAAVSKGTDADTPAKPAGVGNSRPGVINPVSVFVFVPIFVGNSSNTFGHNRSGVFRGSKRKR